MEIVSDVEVLDFALTSDHLPIQILLDIKYKNEGYKKNKKWLSKIPASESRIKWDEKLSEAFVTQLNSSECKNFEKKFIIKIQNIAKSIGMVEKKCIYRRDNPWFDENCQSLKIKVKEAFKNYKISGYDNFKYSEYKQLRTEYNYVIKQSKKRYYINLQKLLSNQKASKVFWETFGRFNAKKNPKKSSIELKTWEDYFINLYQQNSNNVETITYEHKDFYLDGAITKEELTNIISKSKLSKAAGPDQISNEFFKTLNEKCIAELLKIFNNILDIEEIPRSWSNIHMCLLHKKGDINDPNNFRSISLLNHITKLFTTVLTERLFNWVEDRNILQEEQFGFRPGRGCVDAIFTLHSAVSINTRLPGRKVYASFVDFKRAFDSISHSLFWSKLSKIGLSKKMINIFKSLYEKANFTFRVNGEWSNPICVNRGVLQGESASPLLFNLFINDVTNFLRSKNIRGIQINSHRDLLTILYADDLVILTDTPGMLQKALDALSDYCFRNLLEINTKKTRIMVFRSGGRFRKGLTYYINGEKIETVEEYLYLGVIFSSKNVFRKATDNAVRKANIACARVTSMMTKSKFQSWEARKHIFKSIVISTLLYASEIWSLKYFEDLESVQTNFYKRIFNWQLNTPNYVIRKETEAEAIASLALSRALNWWNKMIKLNELSWPKLCFQRLVELDQLGGTKNNNWITHLKMVLGTINLHLDTSRTLTEADINKATLAYVNYIQSKDLERIFNSNFCPLYKFIIKNINYLDINVNFNKIKVISQLRIFGKLKVKIVCNGCVYKWDQSKLCEVCNLGKLETLPHFTLECPIYSALRKSLIDKGYIVKNSIRCDEAYINLMQNLNTDKINCLYYFVSSALKTRSFVLNE